MLTLGLSCIMGNAVARQRNLYKIKNKNWISPFMLHPYSMAHHESDIRSVTAKQRTSPLGTEAAVFQSVVSKRDGGFPSRLFGGAK